MKKFKSAHSSNKSFLCFLRNKESITGYLTSKSQDYLRSDFDVVPKDSNANFLFNLEIFFTIPLFQNSGIVE
ncbi:MAG: hypothetical protein ABIL18_03065 [candidate division WOR-3 bacterium]